MAVPIIAVVGGVEFKTRRAWVEKWLTDDGGWNYTVDFTRSSLDRAKSIIYYCKDKFVHVLSDFEFKHGFFDLYTNKVVVLQRADCRVPRPIVSTCPVVEEWLDGVTDAPDDVVVRPEPRAA